MALADFLSAVAAASQRYAASYGLSPQELQRALLTAAGLEGGLGATAATGDNGASVGRFQFNTAGGHGSTLLQQGLTRAQIADDAFQADNWAPVVAAHLQAAKAQYGDTPEAVRQAIYAAERPAVIYDPGRFDSAFAAAGGTPSNEGRTIAGPAGGGTLMSAKGDPNAKPTGKVDKSGNTEYSDGTYHDKYGNVWDPATNAWYDGTGARVDRQTGKPIAGQSPAAGGTSADPLATAMSQVGSIVEEAKASEPQSGDYPDQQTFTIYHDNWWKNVYLPAFNAQRALDNQQKGVVQLPDGTVVPQSQAPPEVVAAARTATLNAYSKLLNQYGLDQFNALMSSYKEGNAVTQQDFSNKVDTLKGSESFDTLNLSKARQSLDTWLQGQQTAAEDAKQIANAQQQIGLWGTTNGKTSFSGTDLGGAISTLARQGGMDPSQSLIAFPGTQTWNPVQDRLNSLAGMGISNVAPPPPALNTTTSMIPPPPTLNTNVPPPPTYTPPTPPPGYAPPTAPGVIPMPATVGGTAGAGPYGQDVPYIPHYWMGTDYPPRMIPMPGTMVPNPNHPRLIPMPA